ncbi:MAG TPA: dihydrofolate reductase family protein [Bacteroidia bacterium]|jgi:dihydrofolate reductase|nr:dihydrofolate reductase family protein [Bacteroidia bacterium]
MSKLTSFTFISLNGFFKGKNEDTSWHHHGGEAGKFANDASSADNILLFGRKTYEMMVSFWPTAMAAEMFPIVAKNMNKSEKIVCSKTLKKVDWENTTIMQGDIVEQIKQLKQNTKKNITILGSGSLLTQLTDAGLIDQYTIMLNPVALGKGTSVFEGIQSNLELKLVSSRVFEKDGIVLFNYEKK